MAPRISSRAVGRGTTGTSRPALPPGLSQAGTAHVHYNVVAVPIDDRAVHSSVLCIKSNGMNEDVPMHLASASYDTVELSEPSSYKECRRESCGAAELVALSCASGNSPLGPTVVLAIVRPASVCFHETDNEFRSMLHRSLCRYSCVNQGPAASPISAK